MPRARLKAEADDHGNNLPFTQVQHIPNAELKKRLRNFDVFVLPSIEDGFAIAVTEALAQGVPVVVSKFAGQAKS